MFVLYQENAETHPAGTQVEKEKHRFSPPFKEFNFTSYDETDRVVELKDK